MSVRQRNKEYQDTPHFLFVFLRRMHSRKLIEIQSEFSWCYKFLARYMKPVQGAPLYFFEIALFVQAHQATVAQVNSGVFKRLVSRIS